MKNWTSAALGVASAMALAFAAGPAAADADPAFGYWLVESEKAIVEVGPCAADSAKACGAVVWLKEPNRADGSAKLDEANPDEAQRTRPICGLDMIGGFERDEAGVWDDGEIYDPEEGKTYSAKMRVQDDGTLDVRGFVGISLIGKTQTWTRVDDANGGC